MFLSNNGQPELTNLFLFPMSPAPSSKKNPLCYKNGIDPYCYKSY